MAWKAWEKVVTLEDLCEAREKLIVKLAGRMPEEHRRFLVSFEEGKPDWDLVGLPGAEKLPAVQWRLQNNTKINRRTGGACRGTAQGAGDGWIGLKPSRAFRLDAWRRKGDGVTVSTSLVGPDDRVTADDVSPGGRGGKEAIIDSMAHVYMTDAEVTRDFGAVLEKLRQGADIVVERDRRPVAVISAVKGPGRPIDECIALAEAHGSGGVLDESFAEDLKEIIGERRLLDAPVWD